MQSRPQTDDELRETHYFLDMQIAATIREADQVDVFADNFLDFLAVYKNIKNKTHDDHAVTIQALHSFYGEITNKSLNLYIEICSPLIAEFKEYWLANYAQQNLGLVDSVNQLLQTSQPSFNHETAPEEVDEMFLNLQKAMGAVHVPEVTSRDDEFREAMATQFALTDYYLKNANQLDDLQALETSLTAAFTHYLEIKDKNWSDVAQMLVLLKETLPLALSNSTEFAARVYQFKRMFDYDFKKNCKNLAVSDKEQYATLHQFLSEMDVNAHGFKYVMHKTSRVRGNDVIAALFLAARYYNGAQRDMDAMIDLHSMEELDKLLRNYLTQLSLKICVKDQGKYSASEVNDLKKFAVLEDRQVFTKLIAMFAKFYRVNVSVFNENGVDELIKPGKYKSRITIGLIQKDGIIHPALLAYSPLLQEKNHYSKAVNLSQSWAVTFPSLNKLEKELANPPTPMAPYVSPYDMDLS